MKTVLRSLLFIALLALSIEKSNAQCSASDILIQNIVSSGSPTSGTCSATFDLSFTMENNNGNKYIFLHIWQQAHYPDFFNCVNGSPSGNGAIHPPVGSDLTNAFINIGIDNSDAVPVILATYPPDPSVTLNTVSSITRSVLPDGSAIFILHGVTAIFPAACNTAFVMTADFWSSQSAHAQVAQCVNCNITFAINFMSVTGLANCANLTYHATITNRIGTSLNGFYRVYADVNGDGFLSTSVDSLITDTTNLTVGAGVGTTASINGSIPPVNINEDLFLLINLTSGIGSGSITVTRIPSTSCAPLPVTFMSFTANRTGRTNVVLRWQTATEINNYGFAVQRNMGDNAWQTMGFIPTQANSGNSNSVLTYTYTDVNTNKGITQYRIKQVDLDNKSKYSAIRAVRGDAQKGKIIVYPNPSVDGRVTVVFEDKEGTRDITLADMNGHTVKQWKGITNNTLQIENLGTGMYTLRVIIRETGNQSVEKIIVSQY